MTQVLTTDMPPSAPLTRTLAGLVGAAAVAATTIGAGCYALYVLETATGTYAPYARFGPLDGLAAWLIVAAVAWTLAFFGLERRRDERAGASLVGTPLRRLRALGEVGGSLPGFLLGQAILLSGMVAFAAAWWQTTEPIAIGCSVGFFLPLIAVLLPWLAGVTMLAWRRRGRPGPARDGHTWTVLKGAFANILVILALGIPSFLAVGTYYDRFQAWMIYWPSLATLSAVHLQVALGALVDAEEGAGA